MSEGAAGLTLRIDLCPRAPHAAWGSPKESGTLDSGILKTLESESQGYNGSAAYFLCDIPHIHTVVLKWDLLMTWYKA